MHLLNKCFIEYTHEKVAFFLNSGVLKQLYGKHYKRYIDFFTQNQFFHRIKKHSTTDHTSNLYELNDPNMTVNFHKNENYILKKKLKRIFEKNEHCTTEINTTIPYDIRKKLISDLKSITLDCDAAINYLSTTPAISKRRYQKNLAMLYSIKDDSLFYTFDLYGRFHSNFSNLKKEIRNNYLKIDGQELFCLDIKSSQPLFLVQIMKENYLFTNPEINLFIDLVENHDIYNYFKDKCPLLKNDRDRAKKLVVMTLFDDKNKITKHKRIFQSFFPKVFKFIESYQCKYHEPLWKTLQRHESLFIYNTVYRNIINAIPAIKLFTVHDSIYFPLKYKDQVQEIWYNAIKSLKG